MPLFATRSATARACICTHSEVSVPAPQRATLGVERDLAAAARVAEADLQFDRTQRVISQKAAPILIVHLI
jgi:hypothetical protein